MQTKLTLTSFTLLLLFFEIVTFWIGFLGTEGSNEYYYAGWFLIAGVLNLAMVVLHLIKRQKYFPLFVFLLIAIPIVPLAIVFSVIAGMGC